MSQGHYNVAATARRLKPANGVSWETHRLHQRKPSPAPLLPPVVVLEPDANLASAAGSLTTSSSAATAKD